MRNRTELVTNTGSDYDEEAGEFDADDGSDDWKPDPEVSWIKFSPYFQYIYFFFEKIVFFVHVLVQMAAF